jgi:TPR repeat protein
MKKCSSSIKKLLSSAENGDVTAQLEMARRFREGDGVSENLEASMHWYQKAAEAGDSDAMNDLGSMILNGSGCDANPELSVPWLLICTEI